MNFVLIDGSYYVFYRYHALNMWWKKARNVDEPEHSAESPKFMQKYKDTFYNKQYALEKKFSISNPIRLVAKDCSRKNIWRNKLHPSYKSTRKCTSDIKEFMSVAYNQMFISPFADAILSHNSLEADDCIAITTKHILETQPDSHVWIITSDTDYLQLADKRVSIITLKLQYLTDSKVCTKNTQTDLLCKIIGGDKSDNIPSIIPRCGFKTAYKYAISPDLLEKLLSSSPEIQQAFTLNKTLIDFNEIPIELIIEFKKECLQCKLI